MPKFRKRITRDFTTVHNTVLRDMRLGATEGGLLLTIAFDLRYSGIHDIISSSGSNKIY